MPFGDYVGLNSRPNQRQHLVCSTHTRTCNIWLAREYFLRSECSHTQSVLKGDTCNAPLVFHAPCWIVVYLFPCELHT